MTGKSHTKRMSEVWHAGNGGATPTDAEPVAGGQGRSADETIGAARRIVYAVPISLILWVLIALGVWLLR